MAKPQTPAKEPNANPAQKAPVKEPNANPAPKDPGKANPAKAGDVQKR